MPRVPAPGLFYTALSISMVVALASSALTARQSPPPAVAEVAPDAGHPSAAGPRALAGDRPNQAENAEQAPLATPTRPLAPDTDRLGRRTTAGGATGAGGARRGTTGRGGTGRTGGASTGGRTVADGASGPSETPADLTTGDSAPPTTSVPTTAPPQTTTTTVAGTTTTTVAGPPQPIPGPPTSGTQRCVGTGPENLDPPYRQTEDPRSPPCVISDINETNNGGKTHSRGVSATQVNVAVYVPSGGQVPPAQRGIYNDVEQYLNNRYETYGRRLNFVYPPNPGAGSDFGNKETSNQAGQEQQAVTVANFKDEHGLDVFATVNIGQTPSPYYDNAVADKGIVLVSSQERASLSDPVSTAEQRKLQWHYQPDAPRSGANLGRWLCAQLDPGLAIYAGGEEVSKPRKLAYVLTSYNDGTVADTTAIDAELSKCHDGKLKPTVDPLEIPYSSADPGAAQTPLTGMNRLRGEDVTTLICVCKAASVRGTMMPAATSAGFFPEWITTSWGQNDVDRYSAAPPDQMAHAFGISYNLEWVPESDLPIDRAVAEVNPTYEWPKASAFQDAYTWEVWRYPALLMMAIGIQAAGPNLTPETFRTGLESLNFPNPTRSNDPLAARMRTPKVGFGPGDHIMSDDAVVTWWSITERSNWDGAPGTWCYADNGNRFSLTTWRKVDLFGDTCR